MELVKVQETRGLSETDLRFRSAALQQYYGFAPEEKMRFLEDDVAIKLFDGLPKGVGDILKDGFLLGLQGKEIAGWGKVVEYFNANSRIIPELTVNPGTFSMLERIYTGEGVDGTIDNYFFNCLAGQALRNRLEAVIDYSGRLLDERLNGKESIYVLNLGSGSARDTISLCYRVPKFAQRLTVDCIDVDFKANVRAQDIAISFGILNHRFFEGDILNLRNGYQAKAKADFGVLVGILCPLKDERCIQILSIIRRYFKPGSQIIAACLLDEMLRQDLLCAYILKEITGWELLYRRCGDLIDIFLQSGYRWGGSFFDAPTNFYEIGVGIV